LLGSRRGAIGTRLLNLNVADNDHPEPMVQDTRPGGTRGVLLLERGGPMGPLVLLARNVFR